ncbi:MAG: DUF935 family protein [Methylovulum miyakonense]|uniref:DUF935 domain-containing protein n=1 Tax=Methylovulum miyakonense TaxID=645578 RepID=UPI003BB65E5E
MIDLFKKSVNGVKKMLLGNQIATRHNDPNFYAAMQMLPNPDVILRKLGKSQEVYDAIILDAHVIGELRPIRANIITKNWRITPGGDKLEDQKAFELAQKIFSRPPVPTTQSSPGMGWPDVFWNIHEAILRGQRIHEVVWNVEDRLTIPSLLLDRPNRRFIYGLENELRLLTRENMIEGIPVDNYKFLVSRHMPSFDNPYGVALLSACFWPHSFKHNGFRFFVKFCEKYGIPWAVGKYPAGTGQAEINALADGLAAMVEDAIAAIPDAGQVELIEAGSSASQLPQERLIQVCNAEMSKALNSQTLATEINGQGSRAAAETHRGREQDNGAADRKIVESTLDQLLVWTTELNFAGAAAPTFEFYDEAEARKDWVEVFSVARDFMGIPESFAHQQIQIPQAVDGEAVLPKSTAPAAPKPATPITFSRVDFAAGDGQSPVAAYSQSLAQAADPIVAQWVDIIRKKLDAAIARGDSPADFQAELLKSYGDLPTDELVTLMELAFSTADLKGIVDVEQGN